VKEKIRPEVRLRTLRARAQAVQALVEENARNRQSDESMPGAREQAEREPDTAPTDNMLPPDRLSLFLRSLSSRLTSAVDEIRASKHDLDNLNDEVRRAQQLIRRDN
jgi:hypothetical protein